MKQIVLALVIMMLASCSHVSEIGKIGNTTFHKAYAFNIFGPNHSSLVSLKDGELTPKVEASFGGDGIGGNLVDAAGNVEAARAFGKAYSDGDTNIDNSNSNEANANASADAKAKAKANAKNKNSNSSGGSKDKSNRSGGGDGTNPGGGGNPNGSNNPGQGRR